MTIRKIVLLFGMAWMLSACGGESAAQKDTDDSASGDETQGETQDETQEETASEVVKTLADVNGFNITTETFNPRGYDFYGTEVKISAYVKDHSNNPVADGTVVTFVADDNGLIEEQCATEGGTCSVTWTSARDRNQPVDPDAGGDNGYTGDHLITIMARTIGEDSFIDKNSNKQFDDEEIFFTQSEAFLDADDNGVYDAADTAFDEYSDFNSNGQFDDNPSDGMFRGKSCSEGAVALGHCAEQLEVWDTVRMINSSGGKVTIQLYDCSNNPISENSIIDLSVNNCFIVEVADPNNNIPPVGTKISVDAQVGEVVTVPLDVPDKFLAPGQPYVQKLEIEGKGSGQTKKLIIKTESVDENPILNDTKYSLKDT
ncbi:hypothetical protein HF888_15255 [Bermanella marisrubri]|uniref:Invasin domain protein n=1 Tax=Bermanella marisrubri TaxID=207949 RepID=Q1N2J0_9GAMM|nr:hypothetical protein [Bermanella marisrubri]EAT12417.1 invasin domain protein [Oceanobacter sp. RED65] [Bermanella marisrubri]QIZ85498.1 hypothetical protein HF888_15255 [Bermanella marisrubri]